MVYLQRVFQDNFATLYRILDRDKIRLLHLHPDEDFNAPVRASLHRVSLRWRQVYKALSYVWGDAKVTSTITVNGVDFEATTNLVSALKHLRHKRKKLVLWVDAICINQADIHERNRQVQMMATIYRCAEEVIVWLGESRDDSDEAMRLLARWGHALADAGVHPQNTSKVLNNHDSLRLQNTLIALKDSFPIRSWQALDRLCTRSYWRRLWIVQEFILAKRVVVVCGFEQIDGNHLAADDFFTDFATSDAFPSCSWYGKDEIKKRIEQRIPDEQLVLFRKLLHWRGRMTNMGPDKLFELIFDMASRECTDPKDRIFALAGFCTSETPHITVDYSKNENEISCMFARGCTERSFMMVLCYAGIGYVKPLSFLGRHPDDHSRSSWAPDWSIPNGGRPELHPKRLSYDLYSASGRQTYGTHQLNPRGNGSSTLTLPGFILGTSVEVADADFNSVGVRSHIMDKAWLSLLLARKHRNISTKNLPLLQAYFRTIFADLGLDLERMPSDFVENDFSEANSNKPTHGGLIVHFIAQFHHGLHSVYRERSSNTIADAVMRLATAKFFAEGTGPDAEIWARWIKNAHKHEEFFYAFTENRFLGWSSFVTDSGYMGIGPPYAKPGDRVCIIHGAKVPFLVRPVRGGYLLVGEAFVLGMMDDEFADNFFDITFY
jgi:hypothetical protein